MSIEARTIAEHSALVFVQEIQQAISVGLRVTDTNQGAPFLNTALKEIYMVPAADAVQGPEALTQYTVEDDGVTVIVEAYDNLIFCLTVQKAILDGFLVQSVEFIPHGLKLAVLAKPTKPAKVEPAPVVAPVLDATVAQEAPKKVTKTRKTQ
jgi:hypothetical protein